MARWSTLTDPARPDEHPRSSLRTILVFSAILVPVAAIPYVLVRRHYVTLCKEVTSLRAANASLAREVQKAVADLSKQQADLNQEVLAAFKEHAGRFDTGVEAALAKQREELAAVKESLDKTMAHMRDLHGKVDHLERNVTAGFKSVGESISETKCAVELQALAARRWRRETSGSIASLVAESEKQI